MERKFFLKILWMLSFILFFTGLKAQMPTYLCELRNDAATGTNIYEFDIYLVRTGENVFEYASGQYGITVNPVIKGTSGVITASIIPGSSGLPATQDPASITFTASQNCIKISGSAPPGAGSGFIITNESPGVRVCRVRLTHSVAFGAGQPNLTWSFTTIPYATAVTAYFDNGNGMGNYPITVPASHTTSWLTNPCLNCAVAPIAYNVTPATGSYCQGDPGVIVGLDDSELGVTYTLYKDASPQAPTVEGTGDPINFGFQLAGTYTVSGTSGGGTTLMTGSSIISELLPVTPTFAQLGPYCQGDTPGTLPGTSINGITGTWNPAVISTATPGTVVYTFTPSAGQCATTTTMSVLVNPQVVPLFNQLGPYCQGDTPGLLPASSTNGIAGTWSPSVVSTTNAGSTLYTFTPSAGQCATTATMTIQVNAPVVPTFNPMGPYCQGSTPPALPLTSLNGIVGTWSPSVISTAAVGTSTYTFTPNAGQCATTATLDITIATEVIPVFTQLGPYCQGATPGILPTTSNNGITGVWSPTTISTTAVGSIIYTFTPNPGQCAIATTMTVVVNAPVTPTFAQLGPYCQGDTPGILPGTSINGITGTWNPAVISTATPGTVVYTFTPSAGQCATTTTMSVLVNPQVVPLFNQLGPYCQGDTPGLLPASSTNGIAGTWSPSVVSTTNAGSTLYTFTPSAGQCATTATMTIQVNAPVVPTFNPMGPYCQGSTPPALPLTSLNGIVGTWSPSVISTAAVGTSTYTFTPNAGQCATTATLDITIATEVIPVFTQLGPYCQGATPGILPTTSNNGITGVWSPTTISTTAVGSIIYTFTPNPGQCAIATTMTVVVNAPVTPTFAQLGPYCQGDTPGTLPGTSINGITGTWNPAVISTATPGTVVYTFTPSAGLCATTTTMSVLVNPQVIPLFNQLGPYCVGDTPGLLPASSTNGIAGTWSPAVVSTTNAGSTLYTFTPTAGQCATTATMTIVVNALVTPSVTIVASMNPVVAGTPVTFTPTPVNGGTPTYQWYVNTVLMGTGINYTYVPLDGDQVYVVMTTSLVCVTQPTAMSNTITMSVTPPMTGNEFCTMTQGFYGNEGGLYCNGMTTTELLNSLLLTPIVIGVPANNNTFTIPVGASQCVLDILPGGGPKTVISGNWDCEDPGPLVNRQGRLNNALLAQLITLQLNMRLPGYLGSLQLESPTFYVMESSGCGGGDPNFPLPGETYYTIPMSVWDAISMDGTITPTVQDLYNLGNDAIGGIPTDVSLDALYNAVNMINDAFDDCAFIYFIPLVRSEVVNNEMADGLINNLKVEIAPNPFRERTEIKVIAGESSRITVEIYNLQGRKVMNLFEGDVESGVENTFIYIDKVEAQQMYMCVVRTHNTTVTKRMIIMK